MEYWITFEELLMLWHYKNVFVGFHQTWIFKAFHGVPNNTISVSNIVWFSHCSSKIAYAYRYCCKRQSVNNNVK